MTVEAPENWAKLFKCILECADEYRGTNVDLGDSQADQYDFANEIIMSRMRELLVGTLLYVGSRRVVGVGVLAFGSKFFMTMNEQQQQSFFDSIFKLPAMGIDVGEETDNSTGSSAITISTAALLETLPRLHESVSILNVSNFALTRQSDVQELSNIIGSKCETLHYLALENIECPVDDCNKQNSDESDGLFDPLVYAVSGLHTFGVSTKTRSINSMLVSPTALRSLFVEGKQFRTLSLRGLGFTDSHVLAIVDGLSTPNTHVGYLKLDSNPGITSQGYGALLNFIDRANVIGICILNHRDPGYGKWRAFCVDDKAWEGKLNLVSEMNSEYRRLEYLTNGTFTSEERKWQWLERVADLPIAHERFLRHSKDAEKEWDAKHLNFIWYTLCQNPEMMQVFQAQTRTKTRKSK